MWCVLLLARSSGPARLTSSITVNIPNVNALLAPLSLTDFLLSSSSPDQTDVADVVADVIGSVWTYCPTSCRSGAGHSRCPSPTTVGF